MKKADIVKKITSETEISAEKAGKIINIVFEAIAEGLVNGENYNQDRFGTFKIVTRAARKGRNPQTGEVVEIPEKQAIKFVVSGQLKGEINKK